MSGVNRNVRNWILSHFSRSLDQWGSDPAGAHPQGKNSSAQGPGGFGHRSTGTPEKPLIPGDVGRLPEDCGGWIRVDSRVGSRSNFSGGCQGHEKFIRGGAMVLLGRSSGLLCGGGVRIRMR